MLTCWVGLDSLNQQSWRCWWPLVVTTVIAGAKSSRPLGLSGVMHQTHMVQWTWDILSIQDYPGVSNECDTCSSHPLYENPLRWRRILEGMTILERVMTAWHLVDITPPRTSQEAEETKKEWKRKIQITFPVPSVKLRHPMLAFRLFEYFICFWSYRACDYTVTKPRTWPTC